MMTSVVPVIVALIMAFLVLISMVLRLPPSYRELFEKQMNNLRSRGCPEATLAALQRQRDYVLAMASVRNIPQDHLPFLPIIPAPNPETDIPKLLAMALGDSATGNIDIELKDTSDIESTPPTEYFIFDVAIGRTKRLPSFFYARLHFHQKQRFLLTIHETINLFIHSSPSQFRQPVYCGGTRYQDMPYVRVSRAGRLKIAAEQSAEQPLRPGKHPSCSIRLRQVEP